MQFIRQKSLLELLLWSQRCGVTALLFSARGCSSWQSSVTLSADQLFTVVLSSQGLQGWFNNTTSKSQNQVKCRFLLDVVVGQSSAVFQLLTSKNQSLLIWRDTLLVLDLLLDILNCVTTFNFKGDGLTSQSLDENLHVNV